LSSVFVVIAVTSVLLLVNVNLVLYVSECDNHCRLGIPLVTSCLQVTAEIARVGGHYAVQGHSGSPILVPV